MYPFYLELELFKPVVDYFKKHGHIVKREVRKVNRIAFSITERIGLGREELAEQVDEIRNIINSYLYHQGIVSI